jgi:ubiquitin carboxyl-terminal hydrolase 8
VVQNEVGKHQRTFRGCEQQDSHEFLTILMDWLHLDLQFTINVPAHKVLTSSHVFWHSFRSSGSLWRSGKFLKKTSFLL